MQPNLSISKKKIVIIVNLRDNIVVPDIDARFEGRALAISELNKKNERYEGISKQCRTQWQAGNIFPNGR